MWTIPADKLTTDPSHTLSTLAPDPATLLQDTQNLPNTTSNSLIPVTVPTISALKAVVNRMKRRIEWIETQTDPRTKEYDWLVGRRFNDSETRRNYEVTNIYYDTKSGRCCGLKRPIDDEASEINDLHPIYCDGADGLADMVKNFEQGPLQLSWPTTIQEMANAQQKDNEISGLYKGLEMEYDKAGIKGYSTVEKIIQHGQAEYKLDQYLGRAERFLVGRSRASYLRPHDDTKTAA